jgi:prepilin-type N-terminal cleavage/methylation domain-containing protein
MSHFKGIMRNKKGLTLVEVVVAMGLFGVIMVTLFPVFLITNLMNITSREFTDANFEAQSELEEIYNLSKETDAKPGVVIGNMGYTACSVNGAITSCSRSDDKYNYVIDYSVYVDTEPDPDVVTSLTNIIITVSNKVDNPQLGEDRARLQLILLFDGGN